MKPKRRLTTYHELGNQYDAHLKHKEFILEVFEKVDAVAKDSWSTKVNARREVKSEVLLQFCKSTVWDNVEKLVITGDERPVELKVIEKFIVAAFKFQKEDFNAVIDKNKDNIKLGQSKER